MPIHKSVDSEGHYYQYGDHGKKYYYISGNKTSETKAKNKAIAQTKAIHASGWKGH